MKSLAIVSALMLVLVVGIAVPSAFADNTCVPEDGKSCVFNLKKGDVKVKDLTLGPFNIGGSGEAVDQEARDGVTNANAEIAKLQGDRDVTNGNVANLSAIVEAQAQEIAGLKAVVANLSSSAITDIEFQGPPAPEPVPEPEPVPSNDTNSTG